MFFKTVSLIPQYRNFLFRCVSSGIGGPFACSATVIVRESQCWRQQPMLLSMCAITMTD